MPGSGWGRDSTSGTGRCTAGHIASHASSSARTQNRESPQSQVLRTKCPLPCIPIPPLLQLGALRQPTTGTFAPTPSPGLQDARSQPPPSFFPLPAPQGFHLRGRISLWLLPDPSQHVGHHHGPAGLKDVTKGRQDPEFVASILLGLP